MTCRHSEVRWEGWREVKESEIPARFVGQWLAAEEELSIAAMELNRATLRYQAAIQARIVLREVIEGANE